MIFYFEKIVKCLWPFRMNNNMGDYKRQNEETECNQSEGTERDFFDWSEVFLTNARTKSHARDIRNGL